MLKDKQKRWINEFNCGVIVQLCNHNIEHLIYGNLAKQANKIKKKTNRDFNFLHDLFSLKVMKWSCHMQRPSPRVFPTWSFISSQPADSGQQIIHNLHVSDDWHASQPSVSRKKRCWIDQYCMCARNEKNVQPDIAWKHDHAGHPALLDWQVFNLTCSDREHL